MQELPSEYAGQCVAMIDDTIVASADNTLQAYQKAKQLYPHKMITLMFIPTEKELITFL